MRKTLILAPLALVGFAAGAAGVTHADSATPAATPTTIPGIPVPDLESIMEVLTPEQLSCIVQNMGSMDASADPAAALSALTDCGVSMDQLLQITTGEPVTGPVTPASSAVPGGAPDAATIAAVLGLLGLDATELSCLSASLAVPPVDDAGALAVLQACQISLAELLGGIVSANTGATAATTATTVPAVNVATTAALSTGDPIADLFVQQFSAMGMTITPEQAACLGQQVTSGAVDPATIQQDFNAITQLLTTCGIDIADLVGG